MNVLGRRVVLVFWVWLVPVVAGAQVSPPSGGATGPGGEPWGTTAPACSGGGDVIAYDGSLYDATAAVCVDPAAPSGSLIINSDGNVIIQSFVSAAANLLDLLADDDGYVVVISKSPADNAILDLYTGAGIGSIRLAASGASYFNSGNVGFDTSTPDATVHIVGTFGVEPTDTAGAFTNGMYWDGTDLILDGDIDFVAANSPKIFNRASNSTTVVFSPRGQNGTGLGGAADAPALLVGNVTRITAEDDGATLMTCKFFGPLSAAPSGSECDSYWDTDLNMICYHNGTNWLQADDWSTICT